MTNTSKNKGSGFERECAKILSNIYGEHFNRNISGSGSFLGGRNSYRKKIISESMIETNKGDIICPQSFNGRFVIETKFYKEFPFHHFLINKEISDLRNWINQQKATIDDGDVWIVVFKINRAGMYIVIPEKFINDDIEIGSHSIYYQDGERYIVAEFEPFMKLYKDHIFKLCQK